VRHDGPAVGWRWPRRPRQVLLDGHPWQAGTQRAGQAVRPGTFVGMTIVRVQPDAGPGGESGGGGSLGRGVRGSQREAREEGRSVNLASERQTPLMLPIVGRICSTRPRRRRSSGP
jgi:hypothetical protein